MFSLSSDAYKSRPQICHRPACNRDAQPAPHTQRSTTIRCITAQSHVCVAVFGKRGLASYLKASAHAGPNKLRSIMT
jgi:hypothetical protein